jgi:hypothetical protein
MAISSPIGRGTSLVVKIPFEVVWAHRQSARPQHCDVAQHGDASPQDTTNLQSDSGSFPLAGR